MINKMESRKFNAEELKENMRQNDVSVKELAELLGVSTHTVYVWLEGRQAPRKSSMDKINELFGDKKEVSKVNEVKRNASGYYDPTAYKAIMNSEAVYRGEIYYVERGKFKGESSCDASRPAIIVSNNAGNKHSQNVEIVYLTSQANKDLPTHVDVMCKVPSVALCEQVYTIHKDKLMSFIRRCTDKEMEAVDSALMISLGLKESQKEQDNSSEVLIHDLETKLAQAQVEITTMALERGKLENKVAELKTTLKETPVFPVDTEEVTRLKAQIEILEKQNERLLDRLIG